MEPKEILQLVSEALTSLLNVPPSPDCQDRCFRLLKDVLPDFERTNLREFFFLALDLPTSDQTSVLRLLRINEFGEVRLKNDEIDTLEAVALNSLGTHLGAHAEMEGASVRAHAESESESKPDVAQIEKVLRAYNTLERETRVVAVQKLAELIEFQHSWTINLLMEPIEDRDVM